MFKPNEPNHTPFITLDIYTLINLLQMRYDVITLQIHTISKWIYNYMTFFKNNFSDIICVKYQWLCSGET